MRTKQIGGKSVYKTILSSVHGRSNLTEEIRKPDLILYRSNGSTYDTPVVLHSLFTLQASCK